MTSPSAHSTRSPGIRARGGQKVRIGPISVIALVVVICMAVLAVLAASTSHAAGAVAERQAQSTTQLYLAETAGQEFVAGVDAALSDVRDSASGPATAWAGAAAVEAQLDSICQSARQAVDGQVDCAASISGAAVTAEFTCAGARQLTVAITIRDDATFRVDKWKMASVQQEAPPAGTLWQGA